MGGNPSAATLSAPSPAEQQSRSRARAPMLGGTSELTFFKLLANIEKPIRGRIDTDFARRSPHVSSSRKCNQESMILSNRLVAEVDSLSLILFKPKSFVNAKLERVVTKKAINCRKWKMENATILMKTCR